MNVTRKPILSMSGLGIGSMNGGLSRVVGMLGGEGVMCGAASTIWNIYACCECAVVAMVCNGGRDSGVLGVEMC